MTKGKPNKLTKTGGIYFISFEGVDKYIKIGTAREVGIRLSNLRTGTPFDIKVNLVIPVMPYTRLEAIKLEDELHLQFEPFTHRGEWFYFTDEIQEYIDTYDFTPFVFTPDVSAAYVDEMLLTVINR